MVTCTLRTRHSEPEPTLISSSLISGSEARTEAGPGSLGPRIVARVSPGAGRPGVPAPGQCCVSPGLGSWLWLPSGHWLPPPAHQCQFRPELPNVNIGARQRGTRPRPGCPMFCVMIRYILFSLGGMTVVFGKPRP